MSDRETAKTENRTARDKIIVALDVANAERAQRIIDELNGAVGAFKIGLQLFTAAGAPFVSKLVERGHKIFLDVKFHDIPNTVAKASVEAARLGVWMFNVHASGGGEMLIRARSEVAEMCEKNNLPKPLLIGVTVLTSSNEQTLKETGIECAVGEQVLRLAHLTESSGFDGVVASPLEIASIRQNVKNKDFLIVAPGIRPESATNDDQKRVMTPQQALAAGADFLVIGRPITGAADKFAALEKIMGEIVSE